MSETAGWERGEITAKTLLVALHFLQHQSLYQSMVKDFLQVLCLVFTDCHGLERGLLSFITILVLKLKDFQTFLSFNNHLNPVNVSGSMFKFNVALHT